MSGILTVLITRAFLALAGYPKLGSKDPDATVHISHMLWGGLLMAVSQIALLGLAGRRLRIGAALVGGIGFGLFIDQVGKQVSNEGYLYAPAAGLIYLSFAVLVVIAWRADDGLPDRGVPGDVPQGDVPPEGRLPGGGRDVPGDAAAATRTSQAAELLLHGLEDGLTAAEKTRARLLLADARRETDRALLRALETLPPREPKDRAWQGSWEALCRRFGAVAARTGVVRAAVALAVLFGFLRLGRLAASGLGGPDSEREWNALVVAMACAAITWGLYVYAVRKLRRDRHAAFRALRTGVLIDLLPGQVLNFTIHQFSAVQDLVLDVLLLAVVTAELRRMSASEHHTSEADHAVRAQAAAPGPTQIPAPASAQAREPHRTITATAVTRRHPMKVTSGAGDVPAR
ncbi:hypothetical protein GCM10010252_15850 [Streptomyces aureoverticillatus]|nr:hypothetical protein GCM10010252_15850 [Streptomyces aureoverticillatus]